MKTLLILLLATISVGTNAQLNYTETLELSEYNTIRIGYTTENSLFVTSVKSGSLKDELIYFTISSVDGTMKKFEKENLSVGKSHLSLISSQIYGDYIYELYYGNERYFAMTESSVFIVKRDITNFEIVGEPVVVVDQTSQPILNNNFGYNLNIDRDGFFVSYNYFYDPKNKFLKRFDFDLKEKWSEDLSALYNNDDFRVKFSTHDTLSQTMIYLINIDKCDDCGLFQRSKVIRTSTLGLRMIDKNGIIKTWIPELPESFVFSGIELFIEPSDNTVVGIFDKHKKGVNEYKGAEGSGYFFCKWNIENGELISSMSTDFLFEDVLTAEAKSYLKTQNLSIPSGTYPKISSRKFRLSNGNYILYYPNVSGDPEDPNYVGAIGKAMNYCDLFVCITPEGEIEWINWQYDNEGTTYFIEISDDDIMSFIEEGNTVNYPNGQFSMIEQTSKCNSYVLRIVDLRTGETVERRAFETKTRTNELTQKLTHINSESHTSVIGLQSNSGNSTRKTSIAISSVNQR